jgi:hypothetical protein
MASRPAKLALANGKVFTGKAFGADGEVHGEVVFNTSMTGYQEILTDPSYTGQIVTMTYPLIGNYGINTEDVESQGLFLKGFIVKELCEFPSNYRSTESLDSYLKRNRVVGLAGHRYSITGASDQNSGGNEGSSLNGRSGRRFASQQSSAGTRTGRSRPGSGSHAERQLQLGNLAERTRAAGRLCIRGGAARTDHMWLRSTMV